MKPAILILLVIALASFASGLSIKSYSAEYDVSSDSKAVIDLSIAFRSNTTSFSWRLPKDASQVEVPGYEFQIISLKDYNDLSINGTVGNVEIRYATYSVIEKTGDHFFILDLSNVRSDTKSVFLKLPEEATLKYSLNSTQSSIIPKTKDVVTDGKRMIIHWDESDFNNSTAVLVIYNLPYTYAWLGYPLVIVILASIAGFLLYHFGFVRKYIIKNIKSIPQHLHSIPGLKDSKSLQKKELTRNLFEEEKLVVEILHDTPSHELWQKQLALKSGLSKVALSRKLRSLEAKGLIEKIPYGNTNKIRLKMP